jgi:Mg/Co/Ni transporter MgtE
MYNSYHLWLIVIALLLAYFITRLLWILGLITLQAHRRLWNILLAATLIVSGALGIVLAYFIDSKFTISWYHNLLWYHVEFGIAMAVIGLIHFAWHFHYYFPRQNKDNLS